VSFAFIDARIERFSIRGNKDKTMWFKLMVCVLMVVSIASAAPPCFARSKDDKGPSTLVELKARVGEARAKSKRLVVKLKTGRTIVGLVAPVSEQAFSVTEPNSFFGRGGTNTVHYSDVASIKRENPFVRALKEVGAVTGVISLGAMIIPVLTLASLFGYRGC
jgi:hypothetical protein